MTLSARPMSERRPRAIAPALAAWSLLTTPLWAQPVPVEVPSGQGVTLNEVLLDEAPGELWVRFRFVAPGITRDGGGVDHDMAAMDMDHLCNAVALPYLQAHTIEPARVVISMSDRPVEFGVQNPDATQFFEAYRQDGTHCILEEF